MHFKIARRLKNDLGREILRRMTEFETLLWNQDHLLGCLYELLLKYYIEIKIA